MLKVLFAGSPDCAVASLEEVARKHLIVAVLTNPPAPQGRSPTPIKTAIEQAAVRLKAQGLIPEDTPILTPAKLNDEVRAAIAERKPDIMACFAYGKLFGPKTLALFPMGAINLHPSLLPRWRGCAPVPAAILAQDSETGITIQKMALEMDSGDILIQKKIPLNGTETAETLLELASREGAPLMVQALDLLEKGTATGIRQNADEATFCTMLKKEDGEIDWSQSAAAIDARVRAFTPWPGAFTAVGDQILAILKAHPYRNALSSDNDKVSQSEDLPGYVIGIDKKEGILVQTGNGILVLERLQWRTRKPLDWKSFLNGSRDFITTQLGKRI
jgi:methionyl-tRNA formyltransferase